MNEPMFRLYTHCLKRFNNRDVHNIWIGIAEDQIDSVIAQEQACEQECFAPFVKKYGPVAQYVRVK